MAWNDSRNAHTFLLMLLVQQLMELMWPTLENHKTTANGQTFNGNWSDISTAQIHFNDRWLALILWLDPNSGWLT